MRYLKPVLAVGGAVLVIVGIAAAVMWWPRATGPQAGDADEGVWTCSMHPQVRLPGPGQCPICGMTLIPAAQQSAAEAPSAPLPVWETEPVVRRALLKEVQTVGKLDYNEARVELITARVAGRVDRLFVDFTGIEINKNDHLVEIYSPELYSAQVELIKALEATERNRRRSGGLPSGLIESTVDASRNKLRLWGILPEQIEEIEKSRKPQTHITIYAPLTGTVIEKQVRLGQYVEEGDPLYRIAELDPIWLYLALYEYDIAWMRYGQPVQVAIEAFPGETFEGQVTFIDPFLDEQTRTIRVRVNLKNPEGRLKAGMYATATIRVRLLADGRPAPTGLEGKYSCPMHPDVIRETAGNCPVCDMALRRIPDRGPFADLEPEDRKDSSEEPGDPLAIRASAVLDTGRRQIAYRQTADGNYELVELKIGPLAVGKDEAGNERLYHPVLSGLQEGDRVVIEGGYLLDSQAQIEGRPSLLYPEGQSASALHAGHAAPPPAPPTGEARHEH